MARVLLDNPGDRRGMDGAAKWTGVSERTLSRRFVAETSYSYSASRQSAWLMRELELLAEQVQVTIVALDLGHGSVSAFIALFKRAFGVTPSGCFTAV